MDKFTMYVQQHFAWIFGFGSLAVGLVALYYARRNARRELTYFIATDTSLITRHGGPAMVTQEQVRILYGERPVDTLRLVVITLRNTGEQPVVSGEFEDQDALCIVFPDGTELLEPEIISKEPENLTARIEAHGSSIFVRPALFNKGSSFSVKVLLPVAELPKLRVLARIEGIKGELDQKPPFMDGVSWQELLLAAAKTAVRGPVFRL